MANESYQENVLQPESTLYQLLVEFFWTYWYWTTGRLSLFAYCCGIVLNSTTLVIFFNIGFTSNANITFFALAIADLYYSFHEVMQFTMADFYYSCDACGVFLGYLKNIGIYQATETTCAWITTVITFERLCCIAFPMKVKSIFTPKTTILLILGYIVPQIVVIMMATAGFVRAESLWNDPSYYNLSVSFFPIFSPDAQRQYDTAELLHRTIPSYTGYGVNLLLYVVITIATTLLVILFSRSNKQRNILMAKKKPESSAKDAKVYKAVIVVCALYIVTAGPNNLLRMFINLGILDRLLPSRLDMRLIIYVYFQYVMMVFHAINHSVNIFVYLTFNSRFRSKFMEIFCRKKHAQM